MPLFCWHHTLVNGPSLLNAVRGGHRLEVWLALFRRYLFLAHFCLFIYFELVSGIIKYWQLHIYADDLQIYSSSNIAGFQECYDKMNLDLGRIHEWTTINGLRLNPTKSKVILIHQSKAVNSTSIDIYGNWRF
jgi:hypothetical protein